MSKAHIAYFQSTADQAHCRCPIGQDHDTYSEETECPNCGKWVIDADLRWHWRVCTS